MHPWVNLQSMLEKCLVGNLVQSQPSDDASLSAKIEKLDTKKSLKLNKTDSLENANRPVLSKEIPVLDSYQTPDVVNVVLYTKCKNLKDNCLTIDKSDEINSNNIILFVYTPNGIYKYVLGKYFHAQILYLATFVSFKINFH